MQRVDDESAGVDHIAVRQKAPGIVQWLVNFPPFDQMERSHCEYLVDHCLMRYYDQNEIVLQADAELAAHGLFIVRKGRVQTVAEEPVEFQAGELFPIASLLQTEPATQTYLAAEESFCLFLPHEACAQLLSMSTAFRSFCLQGASSLLNTVFHAAQTNAKAYLGGSYTLDVLLSDLCPRTLLSCMPDTAVQLVVRRMHDYQVSSMVVVDDQQHLLGIFTLRDLRKLIAGGQYQADQAVGELMTPEPLVLSGSDSAFDAALLMAEHHIGHICLVDGNTAIGVVSERDIFSLQRVDLVHLSRAIRHASDLATIKQLQADVDRLVDAMLAHGARAEQITRLITQFNDHTVCRLIELELPQHPILDQIRFSWLAFGSEARAEQTRHTDQDNGIVFQVNEQLGIEGCRAALTSFALRINKALDACSLRWCEGNIMASNPELCLSEQEWVRRFQYIVERPAPEQLLQSMIYFDCRTVWGDTKPLVRLWRRLLAAIHDQPVFQHLLAQAAVETRVPSGRVPSRLEAFVGPGSNTLDIKKQAMAPLVDCVRVLALANACTEPSTLARLAYLQQKNQLSAEQVKTYTESYRYLQLLRLQTHQQQLKQGGSLGNVIQLDTLSQLDARVLRESLRHVRQLQRELAQRYRL